MKFERSSGSASKSCGANFLLKLVLSSGKGLPLQPGVWLTSFMDNSLVIPSFVAFTTLYPGWYSGRAIHIHMKVHVGGAAEKNYSGGHAWPTPVSSSSPKTSPNASPESSLIQSGSTCIAPLRQRMESLTHNTVPQGVLVAASTANSSWTSPMGSGSCACRHTACARARLERWARTLRRHC